MLRFELIHPLATHAMLGYIPSFLSESDERPAKEQIDSAYRHGGGWQPFDGFRMTEKGLEYPGDPPMRLIAEAKLRSETIRLYEGEWLAIIQPNGDFEVARMD